MKIWKKSLKENAFKIHQSSDKIWYSKWLSSDLSLIMFTKGKFEKNIFVENITSFKKIYRNFPRYVTSWLDVSFSLSKYRILLKQVSWCEILGKSLKKWFSPLKVSLIIYEILFFITLCAIAIDIETSLMTASQNWILD